MKPFTPLEPWEVKKGKLAAFLFCIFLAGCFQSPVSWGDTKTWDAQEGTGSFHEDGNWYPDEAPASQDDAVINAEGAAASAGQTFLVKSLTIGGHQASTFTTEEFVSGTVEPGQTTGTAVHNRRSGKMVIKGDAGTIRLKGTYQDSEESLAERPSFVFYVK